MSGDKSVKPATVQAANTSPQKADKWAQLSQFTDARIALGRAGVSLPTSVQLQFNVDHAHARDAVKVPLDIVQVMDDLASLGLKSVHVTSQAQDRRVYLQRPDLGRQLSAGSIELLKTQRQQQPMAEVIVVLVDGLSSLAVQNAGATLAANIQQQCEDDGFCCADIVVVEQGRVAIGDEIGQWLGAQMVVLIVGERPGLSSPDSLGIYFTYSPKKGLTDARRNCISNIRPAGLSIEQAAEKTLWLVQQAAKLKTSGVELKDNTAAEIDILSSKVPRNFLLPE